MDPARSAQQRKIDTLARLERHEDGWVATADGAGAPYLVPLSSFWDGAALVFATPEKSVTGRNLTASGRARVAVGPTRDVVVVEGRVEVYPPGQVPDDLAEAFAAAHWDARREKTPYAYYRIVPELIQAWREVNEIKGRDLMRDGTWLV
jgi:Pyridoxamine 5'-phosphate oxidase